MSRIIFAFLTFCLLVVTLEAYSQYDPDAKKILDKMSDKYKSIDSFTADIKYTLENVEDDLSESFVGEIGVKGDMFRLVAEEQEIIIKDGTVWTYLADANEVNIDNYEPEDGDVTPSTIYSIYQEGYKYTLFGETSEGGKSYYIVDLAPEDKDSDYFRIRLVIEKSSSFLRSFTMSAKSGNRYSYEISNFASFASSRGENAGLTDSYFTFDSSKYEDIEVIDLRIDN